LILNKTENLVLVPDPVSKIRFDLDSVFTNLQFQPSNPGTHPTLVMGWVELDATISPVLKLSSFVLIIQCAAVNPKP